MSIHNIAVQSVKGEAVALSKYAGKVLLIVNTASKCGLTPQYEGLEKLYKEYQSQGLEILGFPANNFLQQEPGTDDEIKEFCSSKYGVSFPLFKKSSVVGEDANPLYKALIAAKPETVGEGPHRARLQGLNIPTTTAPQVLWNFEKFLVDKKGVVVGRFAPDLIPTDERIVAAIKTEIAK